MRNCTGTGPTPSVSWNWNPRCVDCEEVMPIKDTVACGGARCKTRRCKKCHNGRKALRTWFSKAGRSEEWENMSMEERREPVINNKEKGAGKGHKRVVVVEDRATCSDKLKLEQERPFLTKKQFLDIKMSNVNFKLIEFLDHVPYFLSISCLLNRLTPLHRQPGSSLNSLLVMTGHPRS